MRSFVLSFLLMLGLTASASAQAVGTITGGVTDEAGRGVLSVQVFVLGPNIGTLSQADGRYLLLNVPAGTHTLRAERIGYQPVTVDVTVGSGTTVVGRLTLPEGDERKVEWNWALYYAYRVAPGVTAPREVQRLSFRHDKGWDEAWQSTPEGRAYFDTLAGFFV